MTESTVIPQISKDFQTGGTLASPEQNRYKCSICPKTYKSKSALETHTFYHTNERPFKCKTCGTSFKTSQHLKQHGRVHSGEKPYSCTKCPLKCSTTTNLKKHVQRLHERNLHPRKTWECVQCHRGFYSTTSLSYHMKTHSDLKPFVCIICNYPSGKLAHLMSHIGSKHLLEKPFRCDQCPARYAQAHTLRTHVNSVHKTEEWEKNKCAVCENIYRSRPALQYHMTKHTGEKPYKCSVCNKAFPTKSCLTAHSRIHAKSYSCTICKKLFPSARDLKRHEPLHDREKQYKCTECSLGFVRLASLTAHVKRVHLKERPFECTICDKSFFLARIRDKHLASHLNEKPHQCHVCGKRFKDIQSIKHHLKLHNHLTDHLCSRCPKRFVKQAELMAHYLKAHVGSKDNFLACLFCHKTLRSISSLELHVHTHTREQPHFCNECDTSFARTGDLRSHCRKVHKRLFDVNKDISE